MNPQSHMLSFADKSPPPSPLKKKGLEVPAPEKSKRHASTADRLGKQFHSRIEKGNSRTKLPLFFRDFLIQ